MADGAARPPSGRYGWWVVAVLMLAYTFSYVDRTILTLMVGPIRASLGISDVELSLLHGLAFAVFYTVLGIPIGRLVDRRQRTGIVAAGIALWSVMTALCGLASGFGQMFAARIGVGVGEATLSPAAYSMLSDWFDGKRLARALSLYNAAIAMGGGLALMAGGALIAQVSGVDMSWLGITEPWRKVFVLVGLPGIAIALLVLTLREPVRRGQVSEDVLPFGEVIGQIKGQRAAYGWLILGLCCASVMWNGAAAWLPTHFIRNFGWTPVQVGLRYGALLFVCGIGGNIVGGWLAGRWREKGLADSNIRVGVLSAMLAMPFGAAAPLVPDARLCMVLLAVYLFAGCMPYGAAAAAFQEITPNRMRGQVSAIYLFFLNLAGIGFGPALVAVLNERCFGGGGGVGYAISVVVIVAAPASAICLGRACHFHRRLLQAV